MEARDTIMKLADYSVAYSPSEVEVKLEDQAEISFKAGREAALKEVGEWLERTGLLTPQGLMLLLQGKRPKEAK